MAGRVRVREISDDEGNHLKRIVCRGSGPVVKWRFRRYIARRNRHTADPRLRRIVKRETAA